MSEQKKSTVTDISHMYVGHYQRDSLIEQAFERFRKRGYSFNQAKALAVQAVDGFLAEQRRKQVEESVRKVSSGEAVFISSDDASKLMSVRKQAIRDAAKRADDVAED